MIKFFAKYYKPHMKLFVFDLFCAFFASLIDLMYPIAVNKIIDDYVPNNNIRFLVIWIVILFTIFIIRGLLNYWMQYWGHVVGVRMQGDMRSDMFKHLQKLPLSYFDENKVGSLMSRLVNDLMDISELAHHGPEDLFISLTLIIGSFIFMSHINLPITLIVFAFLPFAVAFALSMHTRMMNAFTKTREETASVNAVIENSLSGIRVSKSFVTEDFEQQKFDEGNKQFILARNKAYKVMGIFFSGSGFCIDILNLLALACGGYYTINGRISVGEFASYIMFVTMFVNPIRKLVMFMEQFQNGMSGFKRFTEILSIEPEKDSENAKPLKNISGDIVFDNVSFKYADSQSILENISLTIKNGTTTAFVGESGAGKTTLCHLIPRFYDVIKGQILINNENIQNYTISSLRGKIGIVAQNVFLFTGTIKDNIAYGCDNATMEQIIDASKKANIHDYIESLPDGYDTYIGEHGVKLSGGQKQRISIARVFLKNPPILILDEATSALDNTTEMLIQNSLQELSKNRTTIVVAHRLSTIKNANKIVVLTKDGVAEQGNHQELIKQNGIYKELYEAQFNK